MQFRILALGLVALCFVSQSAFAQVETFQAILEGLQESPPNASPGTGVGTVVLNAAHTQITVDESWSGLTAGATASHIHTAPAGTNGPVTFPFSGVPLATSGSIPSQVFAISPSQVTQLETGQMYMNIHTSSFPGGEIRGQLQLVPEPASALLGLCGFVLLGRRRSA